MPRRPPQPYAADTGTSPARPGPVLVSGLSSDAHTWNLVYLQLLVEECGHEVVNLGPCVPPAELVSACLRHRPALVILSSVNGHGHLDALDALRSLRARRELLRVPVVLGGKLDLTGELAPCRLRALLAAGADAVFTDDSAVGKLRAVLTGPDPLAALAP